MIAKLIVASGKSAGRSIAIKRDRLLIGRAEECDVRPLSEEVSRRHCAVLVGPTDVWVEDQGSRNGTFVNGERITVKTRVRDGDLIRVGTLELKVSCSDPAAKAGSDNDVSKWLMTDDESSATRGADTTQLLPASVEEPTTGGKTVREKPARERADAGDAAEDHPAAETNSQSSSTHAVQAAAESRTRPGLAPRDAKKKADSSRDAAAEALKKFFENR